MRFFFIEKENIYTRRYIRLYSNMIGILFITSSQAINEHYLSPSLHCCCYNVVVLTWIKTKHKHRLFYCLVKKKTILFRISITLKKGPDCTSL